MNDELNDQVVALIKRIETVITEDDDIEVVLNAAASVMIRAASQSYVSRGTKYAQARGMWTESEKIIRNKLFEILLKHELAEQDGTPAQA